jgi:hypothetical protein
MNLCEIGATSTTPLTEGLDPVCSVLTISALVQRHPKEMARNATTSWSPSMPSTSEQKCIGYP